MPRHSVEGTINLPSALPLRAVCGIDYAQPFEGCHFAQVFVRSDEIRGRPATVKIERNGQLHGIQCSERIVHRVGSNERLSAVKVAAGQQNDCETPLGKIGKVKTTQLIECCLTDHSRFRESWEMISRVPGA